MKGDNLSKEELLLKIEKLEHELINTKNRNKKLIETEEQTRFQSSFLNAVEQAVIVTNLDGEIIFWNPFAEKLYGWTAKQAIGKNILDITVPKISHKQGAEIMKNLNAGQNWSGEFEAQRRDGKVFPAFVTDTPILNERGELTGIIGVSIDITERNKAKEAIKISQSRYKNLVETASDAIYLMSEDGTIIDTNQSAIDISGKEREEIVGHPIDSVDPNYPLGEFLKFWKAVPLNKQIIFESTHQHKNGTLYPVELSAKKYQLNNKTFYYGIARDITERQQVEKEIIETKQFYEDIIEGVQDGIWVTDDNDIIYFANAAMEQIAGIPREKIQGNNVLKDFPQETTREFIPLYKKAKKEKRAIRYDIKVKTPAGKVTWQNGWLIPKYEKNTFKGIICTIRDITEHKESELALIESEGKYSALINTASEAIGVAQEGVLKFINQEMSIMLGLPEDEIIGKPFVDFIWPDDREMVLGNYQRRIAGEKVPATYDFRIIGAQKTLKWVLLSANRMQWDGKPATINLFTDITERKTIEKELIKAKVSAEENEERYRTLYNSNPLMIFTIDEDGIILSVNEAGVKQLGYSKEDLLGNSVLLLFHDDDKQKVSELKVQCLLNPDKIISWELRKITKNGKLIYVNENARVIQAHDGSKIVLIMCEDITERKKTEKALIQAKEEAEENEEKFKLLNRLTSEMLLLQDMESIYKFIAENLQKRYPNTIVLTISIDESIQQSRLEAISGLSNSPFTKVIKILGFNPIGKMYKLTDFHNNYFKSGNFVEFDRGLTEFSASEFPAFATNAIERLIGLHKIYTIGINKDDELLAAVHFLTFNKQVISDGNFIEFFVKQAGLVLQKKINEKALTIAKEKAEESDRLKSAFLANMSHEIRTPMNGILGFTNLLKEPGLTGKDQKKFIDIIEKSGDRMLNTINDIIDISKIEAGQITISAFEVNIAETLRNMYSFFKPEAEKKGIQISLNNTLAEQESIVQTDEEKLNSILTNLIKNAIKYSDSGKITFGCELLKGPGSGKLQFYVKDEGIGIPDNRIDAIFERFIQADIGDKRAFQGSGLGLAISKAYVETLGGKIWVKSKQDIGSTFYFTIPYIRENTTTETTNTKEEQKTKVNKLKILIVEDDKTSEQLVEIVLSPISKEILKAKNGRESVEICKENPDIDLLIMDIQLPEMNGYEATMLIRSFNTDVIIIAQTAYALSGDKEKAIAAGCNDYISKPIDKVELLSLIRKYYMK